MLEHPSNIQYAFYSELYDIRSSGMTYILSNKKLELLTATNMISLSCFPLMAIFWLNYFTRNFKKIIYDSLYIIVRNLNSNSIAGIIFALAPEFIWGRNSNNQNMSSVKKYFLNLDVQILWRQDSKPPEGRKYFDSGDVEAMLMIW